MFRVGLQKYKFLFYLTANLLIYTSTKSELTDKNELTE